MVEHNLYALMRSYIPEELHSDFQLTIRDGLRLRHAGAGDQVIGYFGGLPELPEGVDWPGDGHRHYEHVATIDLAELPTVDLNLPDSGRISVFGDTNGYEGALLHFPADLPLREAVLPADLEEQERIFNRVPMTYTVVPTIPSRSWLEEHLLGEDDDDEDVSDQLETFCDTFFTESGPRHQLGGWANEIQNNRDSGILPGSAAEVRFYPDYRPSWMVLIAQFDTDHAIGMGWGDFGTLYCFIDPANISTRDFSKADVFWECY
ncbi:DUF1963 domain-containing protein [Nocardia sp. NPDC046763]|uniref:DUF1963 domain-containing protein n=1 Tax=Nocardia sp. NPDC046763 TaxID=3155256 RepID=UPI0033E042A3